MPSPTSIAKDTTHNHGDAIVVDVDTGEMGRISTPLIPERKSPCSYTLRAFCSDKTTFIAHDGPLPNQHYQNSGDRVVAAAHFCRMEDLSCVYLLFRAQEEEGEGKEGWKRKVTHLARQASRSFPSSSPFNPPSRFLTNASYQHLPTHTDLSSFLGEIFGLLIVLVDGSRVLYHA